MLINKKLSDVWARYAIAATAPRLLSLINTGLLEKAFIE